MNLVSKRVTIYLVMGVALLIIILVLRPAWKRMVTADQTKNLHSVGSLETVFPIEHLSLYGCRDSLGSVGRN